MPSRRGRGGTSSARSHSSRTPGAPSISPSWTSSARESSASSKRSEAKGEAGVGVVTPGLLEAVGRMEAGDYDGAWDTYQIVLDRFESEAKDFHDARKTIEEGDRLAHEVRAMGMDVSTSERLLRHARESLERRDVEAATRIGQ